MSFSLDRYGIRFFTVYDQDNDCIKGYSFNRNIALESGKHYQHCCRCYYVSIAWNLSLFFNRCFFGVYENNELSPAILLPMWIMYIFVVAGFILGALRSLQMAIIHVKTINVPPRNSLEEQVEQELAAEKKNMEKHVYSDYSSIYSEDILRSNEGGEK